MWVILWIWISYQHCNVVIRFQVNLHRLEPYAMSGFIDSVHFSKCYIEAFNAYGINSNHESVYRISFENTEIDFIDRRALSKLNIDNLTFKNTTFLQDLRSQTFYALTITNEMSISNCTFGKIDIQAIGLNSMFKFTNCFSLENEMICKNLLLFILRCQRFYFFWQQSRSVRSWSFHNDCQWESPFWAKWVFTYKLFGIIRYDLEIFKLQIFRFLLFSQ